MIKTEFLQKVIAEEHKIFDRKLVLNKCKNSIGSSKRNYRFRHALWLLGFDKLPQIVSDEEYEKLQAPKIYHGFDSPEWARQLLQDDDYHFGFGMMGFGLYFSNQLSTVKKYGPIILETKLNPSANIADVDVIDEIGFNVFYPDRIKTADAKKLYDEMENCLSNNLTKEDYKLAIQILAEHRSVIAMLLGYQVSKFQHKKDNYGDYHSAMADRLCDREQDKPFEDYVVYDRSSIVVSQSEYERIISLCKDKENQVEQ